MENCGAMKIPGLVTAAHRLTASKCACCISMSFRNQRAKPLAWRNAAPSQNALVHSGYKLKVVISTTVSIGDASHCSKRQHTATLATAQQVCQSSRLLLTYCTACRTIATPDGAHHETEVLLITLGKESALIELKSMNYI